MGETITRAIQAADIWRRLALAMLLAVCALFAAGARAQTAGIESVNAEAFGDGMKLSVAFKGAPARVSHFLMRNPDRIVIDITGAKLGKPASGDGFGVAARFRSGQFAPDAVRLVIETNGPATARSIRLTGKAEAARLELEVLPAGEQAYKRALNQGRATVKAEIETAQAPPPKLEEPKPPAAAPAAEPERPAAPVQAAVPAPAPAPTPPQREIAVPAERPPPPAAAINGRLPVIVLDPGHGGQDPGAPSALPGRHEKEVTLQIARAIRKELLASGRFRVVLTRDSDIFIPLVERVNIARRAKADLFISIHADSITDPNIRGATVYTVSEKSSDREAERLAAKENKADIIGGVDLGGESPDVANILIELAQRETANFSVEFARVAVREVSKFTYFRSNFHRFAGFVVLKAPDVPSVLLETGYMSNIEDSKYLFSTAGQQAIAKGLRRAIEVYFDRRTAAGGAASGAGQR